VARSSFFGHDFLEKIMKNLRWTILASLLLAANGVAQAQTPATVAPAAPMTSSGMTRPDSGGTTGTTGTATGGTADSGSITNDTSTTTTTTTTETTSSGGIGPDGVAITDDTMGSTTELANTGGEPIILTLVGLSIAAGAFFMRRRVSA
jgi:LPXTG-motif cell wall-anchored protein